MLSTLKHKGWAVEFRIQDNEIIYSLTTPEGKLQGQTYTALTPVQSKKAKEYALSEINVLTEAPPELINPTLNPEPDEVAEILALMIQSLPKEQLVGKAILDAWDKSRVETEVIAVTKQRVIDEVISTGNKTTHTYEMTWNGILWEKSITGVLLNDSEVLCITRNLQDYQRKYWENFLRLSDG